jgi:hypothetical protein
MIHPAGLSTDLSDGFLAAQVQVCGSVLVERLGAGPILPAAPNGARGDLATAWNVAHETKEQLAHAPVAQTEEQRPCKTPVAGATPAEGSTSSRCEATKEAQANQKSAAPARAWGTQGSSPTKLEASSAGGHTRVDDMKGASAGEPSTPRGEPAPTRAAVTRGRVHTSLAPVFPGLSGSQYQDRVVEGTSPPKAVGGLNTSYARERRSVLNVTDQGSIPWRSTIPAVRTPLSLSRHDRAVRGSTPRRGTERP